MFEDLRSTVANMAIQVSLRDIGSEVLEERSNRVDCQRDGSRQETRSQGVPALE